MSEDFGEVVDTEFEEEKKDNKVWIIVAVVAVILCCCCVVVIAGGTWLYNNGDALLDSFGSIFNLTNLLL
jgi:uncharacterized membrane protein